MTQYFTDFSDHTVGDALEDHPDWTWEWQADDTTATEIIQDESLTGGQGIKFDTWEFFNAYTWDVEDADDVEIVMRESVSVGSRGHSAGVRGSGSQSNKNVYLSSHHFSNDQIEINEVVDDSFSNLNEVDHTISPSDYWLRFRVSGNELKARSWEASNPEPSSWMVEVTDTNLSSGWFGIVAMSTTITVDLIGVGTDGDPAPTEPVSVGHPASVYALDGEMASVTAARSRKADASTLDADAGAALGHRRTFAGVVGSDPELATAEARHALLTSAKAADLDASAFAGTGLGTIIAAIEVTDLDAGAASGTRTTLSSTSSTDADAGGITATRERTANLLGPDPEAAALAATHTRSGDPIALDFDLAEIGGRIGDPLSVRLDPATATYRVTLEAAKLDEQ